MEENAMKIARYAIWGIFIGMFLFGYALSQQLGDYRSAATGNWSSASTWETFDGVNWVAASTAPTGVETITVDGTDSVSVDVAVTITGNVIATETGKVEVTTGLLEFANGSTYEHACDAGSIPISTWSMGSTLLITGTVSTAPENRNQNYYHITLNTPGLLSNRDLGLDDVIIGGNIRVVNTGVSRWRLTSTAAGDTAIVTLMGDMIVESGSFETQGTGTANTTFIVHHYGNINVTGGNFSIARGSQGSGSGTTTWYLHEGNFSMSDATTQNSNPTPGNAKFVFAKGDTQQISFTNVTIGGGDIHYLVSDTTTLQITQDFAVNGLLVNRGTIQPLGTLTFQDGAVYEHAQNGGSVPTATWEMGSTALFTGITSTAPGNRGQDYYNLTLNTPGLNSNLDMNLTGRTISGDLRLISSGAGTNRWRLVGSTSGTVTIMGDVIVEGGSLETQGTSSLTDVEVLHYGDVLVTGGTFAVSRGTQGGTGTTRWYMFEGDFSMSNATARNSNPAGATFIFANYGGVQNITLSNVTYASGGLPILVDSMATLNMDTTVIGGEGNFILFPGATLATGNVTGVSGALQTTGTITLSQEANFTFNGTVPQVPGALLPDTLGILTISNPAGVTFLDTLSIGDLVVPTGALMQVDSLGYMTSDTGTVAGTIVNAGVLETPGSLVFQDGAVYEHARNGGSIPTATWELGSTTLLTGITSTAPANRGQDYYNLTFNTPFLSSNLDMSLNDHIIGGDIRVITTGSTNRWRLVGSSSGTVTIMGDVIVEDGSFETQGTSSATEVVVLHHGDVLVTGGTFSVSRGGQAGTGTTRWYMLEGDFSMSNATTRNSNPTGATFVFANAGGEQNITLSNVTYLSGGLPIEVDSAATLNMDTTVVGGEGNFVLAPGATLATGHMDGVSGALQTTGTIILSQEANFTFDGTVAQVTSVLMPDTLNNLTINNAAGVVLSQSTLINGVLRLMAGVFDNTIPFTLGPTASISYEGGSLLNPMAIENQTYAIPTKFALFQNYPNPFNPVTTIRYDVPKQTKVTITVYDLMGREVAELVNDQHAAGAYSITWNALGYASGVYYYRISAGDFVSVRKLVLMK
jgi:Secretion system C-terminal sorting domain